MSNLVYTPTYYGSTYEVKCEECGFVLRSFSNAWIRLDGSRVDLDKVEVFYSGGDLAKREINKLTKRYRFKRIKTKTYDKEIKITPKWKCHGCKEYVHYSISVENDIR